MGLLEPVKSKHGQKQPKIAKVAKQQLKAASSSNSRRLKVLKEALEFGEGGQGGSKSMLNLDPPPTVPQLPEHWPTPGMGLKGTVLRTPCMGHPQSSNRGVLRDPPPPVGDHHSGGGEPGSEENPSSGNFHLAGWPVPGTLTTSHPDRSSGTKDLDSFPGGP